jgi:D-sedoheptulose 7-phosphate isomerase
MRENNFTGSSKKYLQNLLGLLSQTDYNDLDNAINLIYQAWQDGKQVITFGNGGSALTALHFITDWNKSIFLSHKKPFRGRSLIDNVGLITAYGNDIAYEDIFVQQLMNCMNPGDLVIAISGSGNSPNIIKAVNFANANNAVTLGLCGYGGGNLRLIAQHVVWANVNDMQLSEDFHAIFGHIVMKTLCNENGSFL